jgi:uncharacterized membrane protein YkoI
VRNFLTIAVVALLGLASLAPVEARERVRSLDDSEYVDEAPQDDGYDQIAQEDDVGIRPSEAAAIARDVVPGAKVVGVKLLSNGWYAVTLRSKGSVTRVMVNASDGSVR